MSKRAARYDVAVMVIGAVAFGVMNLLPIAITYEVLPDALFPTLPVILSLVGGLLLAVGIGGVHAKQRTSTGVLGGVGYWILLGGVLASALTVFVLVVPGLSLLGPVSWLMVGVGAIVYGAATLRAEVLARWAAWLLAAGPFGGIVVGSLIEVYLLGGDSVGLIYLGHVSVAVGLAGLAFSAAARPDAEEDVTTTVTIGSRPIPPPSMQPAPRPNPAVTPEPPASDAPPPS